ncbi:hypothetical protein LNO89_06375 [Klebsiella pneumoniae subsp. pneumoniae]|nr:hypothetical protein [Klebsiella pneumoniae subsp. pneumoniae]
MLPLATGGTIAHMLAVDYALKPVLNALKAQEILHGVFADDSQVTDYQHKPQFTANLQRRLDDALETSSGRRCIAPAAVRAVVNISAWGGACLILSAP